ncbi:class I SAM-dependent methyltransferase [Hyphobacterium sp. SN044]|uniref:class I SAM-dependent methyltransferase n=1 Tax=Hyphobacterium sp. SN044 TaxID=2912575 RepID=UPI001F333A60|nr:class I SAM-dependent methyltransferase [Hyphobacterium sp. SN044]MCF8878637.1 class I SAM-dependent methyltransferase [Hyphobacterium sp. SN044]
MLGRLKQHEMGFWQLANVPSEAELAEYYSQKYFTKEDASSHYAYAYEDRDLRHKLIQPTETERVVGSTPRTLLEVGAGEGFTLAYFHRKGWEVKGVDFTADAAKEFNPEIAGRVIATDAFAWLDAEIDGPNRYDVVICNHVLEHVPDPCALLSRLRGVVAPGGYVRISTPNDTSWLQDYIIATGRADPEYFVCVPDHINYFNAQTLRHVVEAHGFEIAEFLTEFPVDLFLLNDAANYMTDRTKGRGAHWARTEFELALMERSIDDLIAFRRTCAEIGIGRALTVYARPSGG